MPSQKKHHNHHNHHQNNNQSLSLPGDAGDDAHAAEPEVFVDAQQEVQHNGDPQPHHGEDKGVSLKEDGGGHHHSHGFSAEDKILNLKQLNETLVKEVCSSRAAMGELEAKVKALEEQVQENAAKADALAVEKNILEEEKLKFELEVAANKEQVVSLGEDKEGLVAENGALLAQKKDLQAALSEAEAKHKDVIDQLQETVRALNSAEENAEALNVESARLRGEEKRLSDTIQTLQASKEETLIALHDLQEKKLSLEEKLFQTKESVAAAETQIGEANAVIESLQTELSTRAKEREGFEMQLKEAWQQIATLEAQREVRVARENSLQIQLKSLEEELADARREHESVSAAVEQEREDKGSLKCELETVSSKSRELELHLDFVKTSMSKLESDCSKDQERVLSLENELSALTEEKVRLEEIKGALEKELAALNLGSMKASSEAKSEIEKLQATMVALERALADARDRASEHDTNVTQLEVDIRELNFLVKRREKLTKMSLPLAIASSGSLLALGISALLKRSRQR